MKNKNSNKIKIEIENCTIRNLYNTCCDEHDEHEGSNDSSYKEMTEPTAKKISSCTGKWKIDKVSSGDLNNEIVEGHYYALEKNPTSGRIEKVAIFDSAGKDVNEWDVVDSSQKENDFLAKLTVDLGPGRALKFHFAIGFLVENTRCVFDVEEVGAQSTEHRGGGGWQV